MTMKIGLITTGLSLALIAGCGANVPSRGGGGGSDAGVGGDKDLAFGFEDVDLAGFTDDAGDPGAPNICGDNDPQCQQFDVGPGLGKPFPLSTDPNKDPNAASDGVGRNPNGWLVLDQTQA